ncbi:hypothetical protein CIB87_05625 [Priestia megaterium]|uniref:Uncharacterized protein n=1 Tax=Priestia megaterium TaxID=1404 RepID=A0AA86IF26_PRIMG|nr:hypothetical protein [Priestia megaterium]AXI28523.1 hypothetical protein CIB87_05625 [Priestia megaterium]
MINTNIRLMVGLIGTIILCFYGVRGLFINKPIPFVSYLFAVGGAISTLALILELKKKDTA